MQSKTIRLAITVALLAPNIWAAEQVSQEKIEQAHTVLQQHCSGYKECKTFEELVENSAAGISSNLISYLSAFCCYQTTQKILKKLGLTKGHIATISSLTASAIGFFATFFALVRLTHSYATVHPALARPLLKIIPLKWYILHAPTACLAPCMKYARNKYYEHVYWGTSVLHATVGPLTSEEKQKVKQIFTHTMARANLLSDELQAAQRAHMILDAPQLPTHIKTFFDAKKVCINIYAEIEKQTDAIAAFRATKTYALDKANQEYNSHARQALLAKAVGIGMSYAASFYATRALNSSALRTAMVGSCICVSARASSYCNKFIPPFLTMHRTRTQKILSDKKQSALDALQKTSAIDFDKIKNLFRIAQHDGYSNQFFAHRSQTFTKAWGCAGVKLLEEHKHDQ